MKKTLTSLVFTALILVYADDYANLLKEARSAEKNGNKNLAVQKYANAYKKAKNADEKYKTVLARYFLFFQMKQYTEAKKILQAEFRDEDYSDLQLREMLNRSTVISLFYVRNNNEAQQFIEMALKLKCPEESNTYYATIYYQSYLKSKRRDWEGVIHTLEPVTKIPKQHPSNLHSAHAYIGNAYRHLNQKDKALEHYKTALRYAKQVSYKINYSDTEKAIKELSK